MKATLAALLCPLLFSACRALDSYDRSYSLQIGDGKQVIAAGVTLHPRAPRPPAPIATPTAANP